MATKKLNTAAISSSSKKNKKSPEGRRVVVMGLESDPEDNNRLLACHHDGERHQSGGHRESSERWLGNQEDPLRPWWTEEGGGVRVRVRVRARDRDLLPLLHFRSRISWHLLGKSSGDGAQTGSMGSFKQSRVERDTETGGSRLNPLVKVPQKRWKQQSNKYKKICTLRRHRFRAISTVQVTLAWLGLDSPFPCQPEKSRVLASSICQYDYHSRQRMKNGYRNINHKFIHIFQSYWHDVIFI